MLATLILATALAGAPAAARGDVLTFPAVEQTLGNGLKVIVVPTGFPDVVSVQISMQVGSRQEVEPGKSGFAHFFEHMMFRGTKAWPPARYQATLTRIGARSNAYTSDDITNYHTTFTKEDLETVLEMEADRFQNLEYPESAFRTEARAVLGEYNKNSAQPFVKLFEAQRDAAYQVHTYKHTTMGFLRDVEDMPNQFAYSRLFYQRWYRPENATLVIAGDVDPARVLPLVKKHFGGWRRPAARPVVVPAEPAATRPVYAHVPWATPTPPLISVAFHGLAFSTERKDAAALATLLPLFFGETSDLYKKLVVDEQKVDALESDDGLGVDPGLVQVLARVKKAEDVVYVRDEILKAFARARAGEVEARRLADQKSAGRYGFVRGLDTTDAVAGRVAQMAMFDRSYQTTNRYYRVLDGLTPADLLAVARATFLDQGLVVTTLSKDPLPGGIEAAPPLASLEPKAPTAASVPVTTIPSKLPQLTLRLVFEAGSARDPKGKEGLATLTAALLTDAGSRTMKYDDIIAALHPLAAGLSAQVDKELVALTGSVHRDNWARFAEVALPMLTDPGFREEDFRRLKDARKAALVDDLRANNDEELGKEVLQGVVFAGTPYAHPAQGTVAGLDAITLDDVKTFARTWYTRANLRVALAGDAGPEVLAGLQAVLAALPVGTPPAPTAVTARWPKRPEAVIVEKDTRAVAISIGRPVEVRRGHPDFLALWVARTWLGEHRSSMARLYQQIREARGMNYGDYAYLEAFPRGMFQFFPDTNIARRAQLFELWLRPVRPEHAQLAIRLALHELRTLIERGLTAAEFDAVRGYLVKNAPIAVAQSAAQAGAALDAQWFGVAPWPRYVREGLAKLTVDDVNRAMKAHLSSTDLVIVAVAKDARGLAAALVADAPSRVAYDSEKPKAVLDEDAVIGAEKLGLSAEAVTVIPVEAIFAR